MTHEERIIKEARYYVKEKSTVRKTAMKFKLSKSTIHKDLTALKSLNAELYAQVREVSDFNIKDRCRRGGQATKNKYRRIT